MNRNHPRSNCNMIALAAVFSFSIAVQVVFAQEPSPATGVLVSIPRPLDSRAVDRVLATLAPISAASVRNDAPTTDRTTVVLHFAATTDVAVASTPFEDALKLSRAISSRDWQRLRFVAWIDDAISGHDVLPVLAAETILVSPKGSIGNVVPTDRFDDETILLNYEAVSRRRALFPDAVVRGLVNPSLEVARVVLADGESQFLAGAELDEMRQSGRVVSETIWSQANEPLLLDASRLRELRAAMAIVESQDEVADRLGLASMQTPSANSSGDVIATLLRITGPVGSQRVRRWQSNLAATSQAGDTNAWMISIDSPGGDLSQSVALAAVLVDPGPRIRTVGGFISGQARGDAALMALACRPLLMAPDASIGGSGAIVIEPTDIDRQREMIALIASSSGRSEALVRGVLDPSLPVYRYVHRQTGRIRYATPNDNNASTDGTKADVALADETWKQEEKIDLSEPLSPARAIELGLADGQSADLPSAAAALGLPGVPPELSDRGLVRFVERVGRSEGLAIVMLMIGFMMLSTEASVPGLGVPGFIAMICFAFFFWTKFLAGTAEWLELLAFGLGIACLGIELFVLPGFGIFGVGGIALTLLGVVLMSQTFVIPRNSYQIAQATKSVYIALGGIGGIAIGLLAVRAFLPQASLASGLSMGVPDEQIDQTERLARYDHLVHAVGRATTPLRPSGKALFGESLVSVISDAAAIEAGQSIRVIQVQGNRIIVEAVDV